MAAETFVESTLKSKKVVVFSKSYCPFCTKAKEALAKFKLSGDVYLVIELDKEASKEATMDEIQDYLQKKTGARSVPRVFVEGKFIGGGDDTVRMEKSGELKTILEGAGVV